MKKQARKIAGILFALCLSACLLTACGGNEKAIESSSETKTETQAAASSKEMKDDSKKEETEKSDKGKDKAEETGSSNSGNSASAAASSASTGQHGGSNSSASQSNQPSASKPSAGSNSGGAGSAGRPSAGNSGSASAPAPAQPADTNTPAPEPSEPAETQPSQPAHTHTWVWATHTETTPEQFHIVEVKKYVCNNCGAQFDDNTDMIRHVGADFWDDCENYTYKVVDSQKVVDVPEQTVTVNDYQYCSECGARK